MIRKIKVNPIMTLLNGRNSKWISLRSDCEQFLLVKLTQTFPCDYYHFLKNIFFLLVSFLLPPNAVGGTQLISPTKNNNGDFFKRPNYFGFLQEVILSNFFWCN